MAIVMSQVAGDSDKSLASGPVKGSSVFDSMDRSKHSRLTGATASKPGQTSSASRKKVIFWFWKGVYGIWSLLCYNIFAKGSRSIFIV